MVKVRVLGMITPDRSPLGPRSDEMPGDDRDVALPCRATTDVRFVAGIGKAAFSAARQGEIEPALCLADILLDLLERPGLQRGGSVQAAWMRNGVVAYLVSCRLNGLPGCQTIQPIVSARV